MDLPSLLEHLMWWLGFGMIHSIMALHKFRTHFPLKGQAYRMFYNLVNTITFVLVVINVPSLTKIVELGFDLAPTRFIFFVIFATFGGTLAFLGLVSWNLSALVGFQPEDDKLQTHGVFAFSRHPVYSGILILLLNFLIVKIDESTLSWIFGCGGYFVIGSFFEERNLNYYFEEYHKYKKNVGKFFPHTVAHFHYLAENLKPKSNPSIENLLI